MSIPHDESRDAFDLQAALGAGTTPFVGRARQVTLALERFDEEGFVGFGFGYALHLARLLLCGPLQKTMAPFEAGIFGNTTFSRCLTHRQTVDERLFVLQRFLFLT